MNIFRTNNGSWTGKVTSSSSGPLTCELKARISTTNQDVSKVTMEYTGPNVTSRSTVTLQYSADGYSWTIVPTSEATKILSPNMAWTFPAVEIQWIKFIFYKPTHDQNEYEYIFSARSVKLFGNTYHEDQGNTFYSKSLSAIDKEGSEVLFSKIQLETCDNTPTNTNISYYYMKKIFQNQSIISLWKLIIYTLN